MAKKKKKQSKKPKQPTEAKIEKRRLEYERELQEEEELLVELNKHASMLDKEGGWPLPPTAGNTATFYKILLRMYKRKHNEAACLKDYLIGVKEMLEGGWDEDEEYFDESFVGNRLAPGHWCPGLIEEIGEMTEEGIVYTPIKVKV